jgi:hypothetical protein
MLCAAEHFNKTWPARAAGQVSTGGSFAFSKCRHLQLGRFWSGKFTSYKNETEVVNRSSMWAPSTAVAENEVLKRRKTYEQHNDRKPKRDGQLLWRPSENGVKSADWCHCQWKRHKWKGTGVDLAAKASNLRRRGERPPMTGRRKISIKH